MQAILSNVRWNIEIEHNKDLQLVLYDIALLMVYQEINYKDFIMAAPLG